MLKEQGKSVHVANARIEDRAAIIKYVLVLCVIPFVTFVKLCSMFVC